MIEVSFPVPVTAEVGGKVVERCAGLSVAADGAGNVYIGDATSGLNGVVRAVVTDGTIRTIAGTTGEPHLRIEYGPAIETTFLPSGLTLDGHGRLYISDQFGARVHALDPAPSVAAAVAHFSVTLNRRGHFTICHGCVDDPGEGTPTLKPGHSRRVGRFRCTAHTHSVTCRVVSTGKGFRMTARHVTRIS